MSAKPSADAGDTAIAGRALRRAAGAAAPAAGRVGDRRRLAGRGPAATRGCDRRGGGWVVLTRSVGGGGPRASWPAGGRHRRRSGGPVNQARLRRRRNGWIQVQPEAGRHANSSRPGPFVSGPGVQHATDRPVPPFHNTIVLTSGPQVQASGRRNRPIGVEPLPGCHGPRRRSGPDSAPAFQVGLARHTSEGAGERATPPAIRTAARPAHPDRTHASGRPSARAADQLHGRQPSAPRRQIAGLGAMSAPRQASSHHQESGRGRCGGIRKCSPTAA